MDLLRTLKNGATAGAAGGAAAGLFAFGLAEPVMDRAVRLESARTGVQEAHARAAGLPVEHHVDVFSRHTQHLGLLIAALATGIALGVLMSVLFAALHRREQHPQGWRPSLTLGASAFFAVYLVPFLRYPANPPGVGDPGTIDQRTHVYLAAVVIGIVGAVAANRLRADLLKRAIAEPARQLAVTAVLIATVAVTYLLPANPDAIDVPAKLLWQFRLLAVGTSLLLWATLTVVFGLLTGRENHQDVSRRRTREAVPQPAA